MPRPFRTRRVRFRPGITYFKPAGVPMSRLNEIVLTMEEFESIRLKDHERMEQSKAAEKMNISQPTFNRVLTSARKKIAEAITEGKAIKIEGGTYKMMEETKGRGRRFRGGMSR